MLDEQSEKLNLETKKTVIRRRTRKTAEDKTETQARTASVIAAPKKTTRTTSGAKKQSDSQASEQASESVKKTRAPKKTEDVITDISNENNLTKDVIPEKPTRRRNVSKTKTVIDNDNNTSEVKTSTKRTRRNRAKTPQRNDEEILKEQPDIVKKVSNLVTTVDNTEDNATSGQEKPRRTRRRATSKAATTLVEVESSETVEKQAVDGEKSLPLNLKSETKITSAADNKTGDLLSQDKLFTSKNTSRKKSSRIKSNDISAKTVEDNQDTSAHISTAEPERNIDTGLPLKTRRTRKRKTNNLQLENSDKQLAPESMTGEPTKRIRTRVNKTSKTQLDGSQNDLVATKTKRSEKENEKLNIEQLVVQSPAENSEISLPDISDVARKLEESKQLVERKKQETQTLNLMDATAPTKRSRRRTRKNESKETNQVPSVEITTENKSQTTELDIDIVGQRLDRLAEEVAETKKNIEVDLLLQSLEDKTLVESKTIESANYNEEVEKSATEILKNEYLNSLATAIANDKQNDPAEGETDSLESESTELLEVAKTRRRRRRGGRRRRKVLDQNNQIIDTDEVDSSDSALISDSETAENSEDSSQDKSNYAVGTIHRRRRRRRGEEVVKDEDADVNVIVKIRDPRTTKEEPNQITSIDGSTRLAAKRQRRKDNRNANKRRAPILTESEFLARRESVDRKMIVRQSNEYTQLAVLEDGILVEHYVDRASARSLIGNVYLGKIQNVLPSMEAAFVDIGRQRNGVLYAGEVDWAGLGIAGEDRKFESVFTSGQSVLVQVSKDPVGAKGARLTGHISLPGRYVVYSPGGQLSGISRKLPEKERDRLRELLSSMIEEHESVIIRTAAENATEEELLKDIKRLRSQWEVIEKKAKQGNTAKLVYAEPDLTLKIIRDLFTEDFSELIIQGNGSNDDAYEIISDYLSYVSPELMSRVKKFESKPQSLDAFNEYRIDEQITKALERKVYLPSGGSLVIDRTEAMTVIDVNTGRFTGTAGNLEATVTSNNLEAAEEIVRQLRLRDLGGIIVVDFIDMVLPSNRSLLLRRLVECLSRDRTRHQVSEITSLGLVQMTRKRIGTGLAESFTEECDCCGGRGYIRSDVPVDSQGPADGGERNAKHKGQGKKKQKS